MKDETLNNTLENVKKKIEELNANEINENNLMHLDKLVDIYKDIKEVENMYSGYGNYSGRDMRYNRGNDYGNYGEYGEYGRSYGRRGYDRRYRGDDELDRMSGEYGRYQESRSYGHGEESDKSFHYMVKSLEDFIKVLYEEAETPQQKQQLMSALQSSMR